jgi:hypothetical protein
MAPAGGWGLKFRRFVGLRWLVSLIRTAASLATFFAGLVIAARGSLLLVASVFAAGSRGLIVFHA